MLSTLERQRIELTSTVRASTTGMLYVLDEPSVGLHPSNVQGLRKTITALAGNGNSVVVEHERELIRSADWVIELGPAAGAMGGTVIAPGTPGQLEIDPRSIMGPFLAGAAAVRGDRPARADPSGQMAIEIGDLYNLPGFASAPPPNLTRGRLLNPARTDLNPTQVLEEQHWRPNVTPGRAAPGNGSRWQPRAARFACLGWARLPGYSRGIGQTVNKGAVATMAAETPTIVLVHGAWADATGFDAEVRALQRRGFRAIGFANPLRDLAGDAAYLAEFLHSLTGPIVLVGHSYGGNVISAAATGNDRVRALVYLNGWMCDEGESQQQLLERFEGSLVGPAIRPVPFTGPDGSEGADLFLDPELFREAFAADVDPETAAVMAAAQRPYAAAAFAAAPSGPPAWKTLPCWYLLGTQDKAIPPALQRFMAERANATIVEVAASHVSFVSQPEAATQLILQAVEATAAARP